MRLLVLLLLCALHCNATKIIDYDALEKSWEAGDEEQELTTEGSEHYRQLANKNEKEAKLLGPQMIFVTMKNEHGEPLADVASRWKEMLWNGGVEVNIYEVGDSKLLVGLQKGIFVDDVRRFLDEQHNVMEYEWNSKAYSKHNEHHHKHHKKGPRNPQRKKAKKRSVKGSKPSTNKKHPYRKPTQSAFAAERSKTNEKRGLNDEL